MLVELRVRDLRNLAVVDWRPAAGAQLLLGDNGAGKTSLLEAIYLAATTHSFRTAQLADCCRHGAPGFHVAAERDRGARVLVELGWRRDGLRQRAVNGRELPLAEHLAALPVLAWTAADAELLTGGPELRRRFVDRGLVAAQPALLGTLARCQRVLRQKRELLVRRGGGLAAWNELLAREAAPLAAARAAAIARLAAAIGPLAARAGLDLPPVALRYRPSPTCALEGEASIAAALAAVGARERERQQTLLGPQRDELEILWGEQPVRRFASAGERKALGLLLLAAQAQTLVSAGRAPLLLLDDVDTELDERHLAALWPALAGGGQVLATSNRPRAWRGLELAARWRVAPGASPRREPPEDRDETSGEQA